MLVSKQLLDPIDFHSRGKNYMEDNGAQKLFSYISAKFLRQRRSLWMESPSLHLKKMMKESSLEVMCSRNYPHPKNLVVQPEGSRRLYSSAALTRGMLSNRPDPDHLDLHTHRG